MDKLKTDKDVNLNNIVGWNAIDVFMKSELNLANNYKFISYKKEAFISGFIEIFFTNMKSVSLLNTSNTEKALINYLSHIYNHFELGKYTFAKDEKLTLDDLDYAYAVKAGPIFKEIPVQEPEVEKVISEAIDRFPLDSIAELTAEEKEILKNYSKKYLLEIFNLDDIDLIKSKMHDKINILQYPTLISAVEKATGNKLPKAA